MIIVLITGTFIMVIAMITGIFIMIIAMIARLITRKSTDCHQTN
jgi:hypothetical protein